MRLKVAVASCLSAVVLLSVPALAVELREAQHARIAITVPDGWAISTDGNWALADGPDHRARARIAAHDAGLPSDPQAEAFLVNFIVQTWGTYTIRPSRPTRDLRSLRRGRGLRTRLR